MSGEEGWRDHCVGKSGRTNENPIVNQLSTLFQDFGEVKGNVPSSWASPSIISGHWALTTSTTWKHGTQVQSHQTTATATHSPHIRIACIYLG